MTGGDPIRVGVIGGSGLYDMADLADREERVIETPFGDPSAPFVIGTLGGQRVAFLARHGAGHRLMPSELNFRANIYALKTLGVEWIVSASAVGSLQEQYPPRDVVVPDQFLDRTRGRIGTFFGDGIVAHVSLAHPVCPGLSALVADAAEAAGATVHRGGTYVCMEGPQFSTLAESNIYRSWNMDIIGMTNLQEAKLAREAEICFATLGLVTDYDCWHPEHDQVTVEMIIEILQANAAMAQRAIGNLATRLPIERGCVCASALRNAIITHPDAVPAGTRSALEPIIGKYL